MAVICNTTHVDKIDPFHSSHQHTRICIRLLHLYNGHARHIHSVRSGTHVKTRFCLWRNFSWKLKNRGHYWSVNRNRKTYQYLCSRVRSHNNQVDIVRHLNKLFKSYTEVALPLKQLYWMLNKSTPDNEIGPSILFHWCFNGFISSRSYSIVNEKSVVICQNVWLLCWPKLEIIDFWLDKLVEA